MPPTPPAVPGYRLEELLGRGGSGEVWRAVPRAGGPAVAVKLLVAGDPARQAREAALLGELDHPHLVRLHEVVHQPRQGEAGRVALVLDLLAGGSLATLLAARGRLRPGEVVTALAPVAAALAHAHERGVVHGDLSPGNVVFTADGRPVLTDLGVARLLGDGPAAEVTPAYVDPTVARGGAVGPASDVFGVAAAAFHALTGVAPWNAADPAGTLAVAAEGRLPDLDELAPDAPGELRAVLHRGLSADPAERGTAAEFALDLRHACRPEPVRLPGAAGRADGAPRAELTHQVRRPAPARPAPPATGPRRWRVRVPRRRVLVTVAGALLAGLLAAGLAWVLLPGAVPRRSPAVAGAPTAAARPTTPSAAAGPDSGEAPRDAAGWQQLVTELYRRRAQAFATGSAVPLGGVYTPGSAQLAADERSLGGLAAERRVLRGFAPEVTAVSAAAVRGDRAELRLVDRWPAYEVVPAASPSAAAVATAPGRADAGVRLVLVRGAAGWRIDSAQRLP